MPAEVLALSAALCFASSHVVSRIATRHGRLLPGLLTSLVSGTLVVGGVLAATGDGLSWVPVPVALFAASGLVGPGLGRVLAMRGVRDAGASVAVPLQSSTNPLLASAGGIVLFGEPLRATRLLSMGLVILGIWLVGRGGPANREAAGSGQRGSSRSLLVLLWPLAAGTTFAASDVLRKAALADLSEPLFGASVGLLASTVVWGTALAVTGGAGDAFRLNASTAWFALHGLLTAGAVVSVLFALETGELSVVSPIVASQPVIVVLLGAVVLRHVEELRPGTIIGAAVVFVGVLLLSFS